MPNEGKKRIQPIFNSGRRHLLQAGLGATAIFLPAPYAWVWAQSEGTLKLSRAPKFALVIGNSNYKRSPLINPANDAKAIAGVLKNTGFDVTLKLDAVQAEMSDAVTAFTQVLSKNKGVGLFYFAGHGLQLAWRNYMIPADADIRSAADIQKQGVDVGTLLGGISKAANPLNVIILDACRDNPFGGLGGVDHKGLSQMDAPPSTLLAYATAPGNVASDGDGANGLYTEHLLKEIAVPDAKVEDVFKRVRLHVRRRTNGQQIPWESTSMEEDFYFVPPKVLHRVSDEEQQRRFLEEMGLWEKIKYSTDSAPFLDYLARHPSGKFSELAQFQLDRVLASQGEKKIEAVAASDNPFTKGTVRTNTDFRVGDTFRYRIIDLAAKQDMRTYTLSVSNITNNEVIYNNGSTTTDLLGNFIQNSAGRFTGSQYYIPEYSVGKRWSTQSQRKSDNWPARDISHEFHVVTKEKIVVPADTFDAYRVEGLGSTLTDHGKETIHMKSRYWIAPGVRRYVVYETFDQTNTGRILRNERHELVYYRQG